MAIDSSKWAKVRADYETGNYSREKLSQKWSISDTAIQNKMIKDGGWIKGKNAPIIEAGIAERNIALFAKLGMTQEKVAEKMVEGVLLPDATIEKMAEYLKNNNPENEDGEKNDDYYKQMMAIIKQLINDKYLSLKYIQELNKMCGTLAPFKKELTGKEGNPLIPQNMSKAQVLDALKDIVKK